MALDVKYDTRDITARIEGWCDQVYPDRTKERMMAKLQEEFKELMDKPLDAWEFADIAIILFDLANHLGFDIAKLIHHKMAINAKRQWAITEEGLLKHVEPNP